MSIFSRKKLFNSKFLLGFFCSFLPLQIYSFTERNNLEEPLKPNKYDKLYVMYTSAWLYRLFTIIIYLVLGILDFLRWYRFSVLWRVLIAPAASPSPAWRPARRLGWPACFRCRLGHPLVHFCWVLLACWGLETGGVATLLCFWRGTQNLLAVLLL